MKTIKNKKIAVIGCGNMGGALLTSLKSSKLIDHKKLLGCDSSPEARAKCVVRSTADPLEAAKWADILIIAVKPQQLEELLLAIGDSVRAETTVISVVAGKTLNYILGFLRHTPQLVRVMPNTPALIGEGMIGVSAASHTTSAALKNACALLSLAGHVTVIDEHNMDALTAISGSGPAYVFFLAEILLTAAADMGIDEKTARELVYQTIKGSAKLMEQSPKDPQELRAMVTSPGGTTEAAFGVLEKEKVFKAWVNAVHAARNRSKILSEIV